MEVIFSIAFVAAKRTMKLESINALVRAGSAFVAWDPNRPRDCMVAQRSSSPVPAAARPRVRAEMASSGAFVFLPRPIAANGGIRVSFVSLRHWISTGVVMVTDVGVAGMKAIVTTAQERRGYFQSCIAEIRGAKPFVPISLRASIALTAVCGAAVFRMSLVSSGIEAAALVPSLLKAYRLALARTSRLVGTNC